MTGFRFLALLILLVAGESQLMELVLYSNELNGEY